MEIVKARLRKGKDDDIKEGLKNLPPYYDHSDFVRDALRLLLFGGNVSSSISGKPVLNNLNSDEDATFSLEDKEISDEEIELKLNGLLGI